MLINRQDISKPECNQDLCKAIEKLADMVQTLEWKIDRIHNGTLQKIPSPPSQSVQQLTQETEQLKNQNELQNEKVQQLFQEIEQLRNQNEQQNEKMEQLQAFQQRLERDRRLQEMVRTYNMDRDWVALQSGLESVLDNRSAPCEQLEETCKDEDPLLDLCDKGYVELMTVLLDAGLDVNLKMECDGMSCTFVHAVAASGNVQLAKIFLNHGADIEAVSSKGFTPIAFAVAHGHLEMVKWLKDHGANISSSGKSGKSVLHIAVLCGYMDIVKYLVTEGADTTVKWHGSGTPLDVAKRRQYTAIVDFLEHHPH